MKLLVTGSSGTVGTGLSLELIRRGYDLLLVDRHPNRFDAALDARTVRCDLTNEREVRAAFPPGLDMVVHLAANARVPHSVKDPTQARDNFVATFNVLEASRERGVRRLLFASSKDVYGNLQTVNGEGDARIEACESPYAASKIGCEALVQAYHRCYGVGFVIARLSNVYGPYSERDRVIPIFVQLTSAGTDLTVKGGEKRLDYVHLDDATEGLARCIERFDDVVGETFNIASGEGISLTQLAEEIRALLDGTNNIQVTAAEAGDVRASICDVSKAERLLGFRARTPFAAGIRRTVPFYLT